MLRTTAVFGPGHRVDDGIINQMRKTGRINSRRTILVCWNHVWDSLDRVASSRPWKGSRCEPRDPTQV